MKNTDCLDNKQLICFNNLESVSKQCQFSYIKAQLDALL